MTYLVIVVFEKNIDIRNETHLRESRPISTPMGHPARQKLHCAYLGKNIDIRNETHLRETDPSAHQWAILRALNYTMRLFAKTLIVFLL